MIADRALLMGLQHRPLVESLELKTLGLKGWLLEND